jgi:lipopolysaccharide export system protein LptC
LNRTWIMLVLVLGVAGVAVLVMDRSAGPSVALLPTPALEGEPDIYMQAPEVSQYRSDGSLEYRLVARDASHFQRDAFTHLSSPALTLFQHNRAPWKVSAQVGTLRRPPAGADEEVVSSDEEVISLNDDVTLEQTHADGERLRLVTASLRLYPRRQYAETDQDVMIDSLFGQTTASGLEGDLQLGMLKLLSADGRPVQTVLQPEQFK